MTVRNERTVAQETQIVGLSSRWPQREIARLLGISQWTVFDVQRKYHVVSRFGREHAATSRYRYDEHAWGQIIELLYVQERLPVREVAKRCNVDVGTIRRRMDALGIPCRTSGESHRGRKRGSYNENKPPCEDCGRPVRKQGTSKCWEHRARGMAA